MHRGLLTVGMAALAVAVGGCGAASEDDVARAASEADAERETKAAIAGDGPRDTFGVKCKKVGDMAFSCTKYELDDDIPSKISATNVLGEYETTCDKPDTCKVRKGDYTPYAPPAPSDQP